MAYFQYKQFLGRMIQFVDDTVIAHAVFETPFPFIALQSLMLNEFCVFPRSILICRADAFLSLTQSSSNPLAFRASG